jgi:hypothetical protein
VTIGPTDDELRAFVQAMLSNLDKQLQGPEVIDDSIRSHRDLWVALYEASKGLDVREADPPESS